MPLNRTPTRLVIFKVLYFQKLGFASRKHYNDARNDRSVTWSSNSSFVNEQRLFKIATYSLQELVKRIFIRYIRANEHGKTREDVDLKKLDSIKEQRHRSFGRCYTLYPKKSIRDQGVYYIKLYL